LNNSDFRAAKMDTGFLDRLLKQKQAEVQPDAKAVEVAAIAAGIFSALGSGAAGASEHRTASDSHTAAPSNWKVASRREALR
jgi:acetyl-CoA carboxylase biotin carboxylase subunit